MRCTFLFLIFLIPWLVGAQQTQTKFIYDFETKETLPKFKTFQTNYEISENPNPDGVNESLLVGRVSKVEGSAIGFSGIFMTDQGIVNLKDGGYMKMKVYATTKMGKVQVKLETEPVSQQAYGFAVITKLNQWQELTFTYPKGGEIDYSKIAISFSLGSVEDDVYYFDDIRWFEGDPYY